MSNGWMGRGRHREVDWGRRVRADHERATQVLWILMGINVLVFVLWSQARGTVLEGLMAQHFLVSAESIAGFRIWTLLTSTFSHIDAGHLIFNLIGLYVFG
ncbi:MAG TPA: rhomboid family intramembrane serine protease, partial [Deltaproteobacteria bacterium]|nr:rhomboid family intramembrane serine protease [Deltaproteobacteria bacterium]